MKINRCLFRRGVGGVTCGQPRHAQNCFYTRARQASPVPLLPDMWIIFIHRCAQSWRGPCKEDSAAHFAPPNHRHFSLAVRTWSR